MPEYVQQGGALASWSPRLWRIFREYQTRYKLKDWGMQYFVTTVNTMLMDMLPRYGTMDVDDDLIHECISVTGLIPSIVKVAS